MREGKTFKALPVEIGVSNGTMTEIVSGVNAGTEVLADMIFSQAEESGDGQQKSNPFMPGPRNRNNNNNQKNGNNAAKK